jgi:hypothetical protein
MVKVSVHQVVFMDSVRNARVSAVRTMHMIGGVFLGRKARGIG